MTGAAAEVTVPGRCRAGAGDRAAAEVTGAAAEVTGAAAEVTGAAAEVTGAAAEVTGAAAEVLVPGRCSDRSWSRCPGR